MPFTFNQTPGTPSTDQGSAVSIEQLILAELRVISMLLAQNSQGVINSNDLDNVRADPSSLNQRLS